MEHIEQRLGQTDSIKDALRLILDYLPDIGVCNVLYGYMLRPKSYVRGDVVLVTLLSDELMDIYYSYGGTNSDLVAENVATMTEVMKIDIHDLVHNPNAGIYYRHKFLLALEKQGFRRIWAYPFSEDADVGHGTLTFHFDDSGTQEPDDAKLLALSCLFHRTIKKHGQLARHFGVTKREAETLSLMSAGKTGEDIACALGVSQRTVEMRLQTARKKLFARTTTEAVYKALAYGILPCQQ